MGQKIGGVEEEMRAVGQKIEKVEAALSGGAPYLGTSDPVRLWKKDEQLGKKDEQLGKEKEKLLTIEVQLRKKEEQLRQPPAQASLLTPGTQAYAVRQTVKRRPSGNGCCVRKKRSFGMFFLCACFRARVFGFCLGSCGAVFDLQICATGYSWNLHACVRA